MSISDEAISRTVLKAEHHHRVAEARNLSTSMRDIRAIGDAHDFTGQGDVFGDDRGDRWGILVVAGKKGVHVGDAGG